MANCHGSKADDTTPSKVAPIFEHGKGRGVFGGEVAPPRFLTEEEARNVIVDEAKKAGVTFVAGGPVLPNISVPITSRQTRDEDYDKNNVYSPKKRTRSYR